MKRRAVILLIFFAMFSVIAEGLPSQSFNIIFEKPGVTDYHFTEAGTTTLSRIQYFTSYFQNSNSSLEAAFGFDWSVYYNGNISISLVFAATNEEANAAYGNPETATGYMLKHEDSNVNRGLNYTVALSKSAGDGADSEESTGSDSKTPISGSARTLVLVDNKRITSINGSSGHVDFKLQIDSGNFTSAENNAMGGQYSGVVRCYVEYD